MTLEKFWNDQTPKMCRAILKGVGCSDDEAGAYCNEAWANLPDSLKRILIDEHQHTGEPA